MRYEAISLVSIDWRIMDERIQIVRATIHTEFGRVLDLEELARLVNLSPSRLRHLFKTEVGKTPTQYLKSIRMQAAHVLIKNTFFQPYSQTI